MPAYVGISQHTPAYVSIRQHASDWIVYATRTHYLFCLGSLPTHPPVHTCVGHIFVFSMSRKKYETPSSEKRHSSTNFRINRHLQGAWSFPLAFFHRYLCWGRLLLPTAALQWIRVQEFCICHRPRHPLSALPFLLPPDLQADSRHNYDCVLLVTWSVSSGLWQLENINITIYLCTINLVWSTKFKNLKCSDIF